MKLSNTDKAVQPEISPVHTLGQERSAREDSGISTRAENRPGAPPDSDAVRIQIGEREREERDQPLETDAALTPPTAESSSSPDQAKQLSEEQREEREQEQEQQREEAKVVQELKERDREVRNHEQAHKSALGAYAAGGIQLQFTSGPNGQQFAVAGSVPVDLSPERDPEETIDKAQTVRAAALAPKEPSSADRAVAAQASQLEAQARAELQKEERGSGIEGEKSEEGNSKGDSRIELFAQIQEQADKEKDGVKTREIRVTA